MLRYSSKVVSPIFFFFSSCLNFLVVMYTCKSESTVLVRSLHTLIMDMAVVVIAEVLQYLMLTKLRHINLVSVTDYKNKIA